MIIKDLFCGVKCENDCSKFEKLNIENIAFDTSQNLSKSLFFCLKGVNTDGHDYIQEAVSGGAVALVVERLFHHITTPQILMKNTRSAFALVCANFFSNPAKDLKIIGITGTNGKTSSCLILKQIFEEAGHKSCAIGTLGYFIEKESYDCNLTTPDPIKLHEIFAFCKSQKVEYVFMEVSAHAIYYEKIFGIHFLYSALTNITQDHLDFFKTLENYKKTKVNFLKSKTSQVVVVNADDPSISEFEDMEVVTYGLKNPADSFAVDLNLLLGESHYTLNILDNVASIHTHLSGLFNVYNVICAATIAVLEGISMESISSTLSKIKDINGRYNVIHTKKGKIILDFAHTPDGLENILKSVKQATFKDIVCVFGCNGNRDRLKRPIMGKIGEDLCEKVFLTSDNPRFENPELIAKDVLQGVLNKDKFCVIVDREKALLEAISMLDENHVVVVCGKGGEKYQDINGVYIPYDDAKEIEKVVNVLNIKVE